MLIRDFFESVDAIEDPKGLLGQEYLTHVLAEPQEPFLGEHRVIMRFKHPHKPTVYLCIKDEDKAKRWDECNAQNEYDEKKTVRDYGQRPKLGWILVRGSDV